MIDFTLIPDLIFKSKRKYYIALIDNFDKEVILKYKCVKMPSLSFNVCLDLLLYICLNTTLILKEDDMNTNILYLLHKLMSSKGIKKITAQPENNQLLNEIIRIFNIHNNYINDNSLKRGTFDDYFN